MEKVQSGSAAAASSSSVRNLHESNLPDVAGRVSSHIKPELLSDLAKAVDEEDNCVKFQAEVETLISSALLLADTGLLATLPPRDFRAGYGEVVKYGLLGDKAFFEWLENDGADVLAGDPVAQTRAIVRACEMKAEIVNQDERETGRRALLNLIIALAVVGLAAVIAPMDIEPTLLTRDLPVMAGLTVLLFVLGWGFRGPGRINRFEGGLLVAIYLGYTAWQLSTLAPTA